MGSILRLQNEEEEEMINVGGCFYPESFVGVVLTAEELNELFENNSKNCINHHWLTKKTKTKSCIKNECMIA